MSDMLKRAAIVAITTCGITTQANALCATQWYTGNWYCKSQRIYDVKLYYDQREECSQTAAVQGKNQPVVYMQLVRGDAREFAIRDEGNSTIQLGKTADPKFASGTFTIEGTPDPINCSREPGVFTPPLVKRQGVPRNIPKVLRTQKVKLSNQ